MAESHGVNLSQTFALVQCPNTSTRLSPTNPPKGEPFGNQLRVNTNENFVLFTTHITRKTKGNSFQTSINPEVAHWVVLRAQTSSSSPPPRTSTMLVEVMSTNTPIMYKTRDTERGPFTPATNLRVAHWVAPGGPIYPLSPLLRTNATPGISPLNTCESLRATMVSHVTSDSHEVTRRMAAELKTCTTTLL